jgi:AbrB family looped-hinge helix DNA binding protein
LPKAAILRLSNDFSGFSARNESIIISSYAHRIDRGSAMHLVTISPKFQVVIPRVIRDRLGLRPGQKLQVIEHAGRLEFVPERDIRELKGFVKGIKTDFVREGDRL